MTDIYEGRNTTLEEAVKSAHEKAFRAINDSPNRKTDFLVTRVTEWGFRKGGIAGEEHFYAQVAEVVEHRPHNATTDGGFDNGNA